MNCKECGKEIVDGTAVQIGEVSFCNNLCRVLWNKKNPGSTSLEGRSIYSSSSGENASQELRSVTPRIVWGLFWFVFLYIVSLCLTGGIIGFLVSTQYPTNLQAEVSTEIQNFFKANGIYVLAGAGLFCIFFTVGGMLPGTGKWKRVKRVYDGTVLIPYGPFASFFLSLLVFLVSSIPAVIGSVLLALRVRAQSPLIQIPEITKHLSSHGNLYTYAIVAAAVIGVPMVLLLLMTKGKKHFADYAAIRKVTLWKAALWSLGPLVLLSALVGLNLLLKKPVCTEIIAQQFRTAKYLWLLAIGTIVLAPLYEELIFRGFLFKGFLESSLGPVGAVMLTGLLWALIHLQYEVGQVFVIFVLGVLLGLARLYTKSIWTSMIMHAVWNAAVFFNTVRIAFPS